MAIVRSTDPPAGLPLCYAFQRFTTSIIHLLFQSINAQLGTRTVEIQTANHEHVSSATLAFVSDLYSNRCTKMTNKL